MTNSYSPGIGKDVNFTLNFPGEITVATPDTPPSPPVLKLYIKYNKKLEKIINLLTIYLFVGLLLRLAHFPYYHMWLLYIFQLLQEQKDIFQLRTTDLGTTNKFSSNYNNYISILAWV